jgi:hypothetical protein
MHYLILIYWTLSRRNSAGRWFPVSGSLRSVDVAIDTPIYTAIARSKPYTVIDTIGLFKLVIVACRIHRHNIDVLGC